MAPNRQPRPSAAKRAQSGPLGEAWFDAAKSVWREQLLKELLDRGAPVDARAENGWTALMMAAVDDSVEALNLLLAAGADVEALSDEGSTALAIAAGRGKARALAALLAAGAGVESKRSDGSTPLMRAAYHGNEKCVRLLVQAGADLDARDEEGKTALDWAREAPWRKSDAILLEAMALRERGAIEEGLPAAGKSARPRPL